MADRFSVRVLLLSPQKRVLMFKYRNTGPDGVDRPCWSTAGGGRDEGETIEQTALREVFEETGIENVRLGPVVWYGEDSTRSVWGVVFKEHFIVAFAPSEEIDRAGWTQHEREQILEVRWWAPEDLRASTEDIFPRQLGDRLEPILAGIFPVGPIVLPPI